MPIDPSEPAFPCELAVDNGEMPATIDTYSGMTKLEVMTTILVAGYGDTKDKHGKSEAAHVKAGAAVQMSLVILQKIEEAGF